MREEADRLYKALVKAMEDRALRMDTVKWEDSTVIAWMVYERLVMLAEVNKIRTERGMGMVAIRDIERVEQQASGHSDYGKKFAWYCAELATDIPRT